MTDIYSIEATLRSGVVLRLQEACRAQHINGYIFDVDVEDAKSLRLADLAAHIYGICRLMEHVQGSKEVEVLVSEARKLVRAYCKFRLFTYDDYRAARRAWVRKRLVSRGIRLIFEAA